MIHIDFDQTVAVAVHLPDAYTRLIPMNANGTFAERFAARRIERATFQSLNRGEQIEFWINKGGIILEDRDGYTVVAFARPHAHDFFKACLALDPDTSILTSGKTNWQRKLSRRLGFPDVELYGRESFGDVKAHPHNILVDDLAPHTIGVQEKMKALGFQPKRIPSVGAAGQFDLIYPTERHIQVSSWSGHDATDHELLDILPRIEALLPR